MGTWASRGSSGVKVQSLVAIFHKGLGLRV